MSKERKSQPASQPAAPATAAPPAALGLVQAVEYAPGAIVSKTLAENAAGTITLFAFDAGQGLSEHSAPFDAHVLVLDGRARLTIDGRAVEASAGQFVTMPANVPHSVQAVQSFKMLLVMLRNAHRPA